ncbi:sugar phosphate isomerase/epimerase family protein [Maioricimonas sp. JC845]|uniref:sugar phosphate isomerase/epimerase family protein n=1 Tax=Maioricimonas sp. JC845 TaxID=3232138 RepID=UPI00345952AA
MPLNVSRRDFLSASLTTAAAATIAGVPAATSAGEFTGKIRKAVKYHMIQAPELSVVEKFRMLRELGYDGVEIATRDKVNNNRDEVLAARDEVGLPIHGVVNSSRPDIRSAVDLSKQYGGTSVLVVAGRVNKQMPYDENYREWSARIREAAPYAEEQGIQLLVENVWNGFLLSPLEMARFIDEIDSPAVGVYFDCGNVVRFGWPEQWIRILGDRIVKLDIKEYSRDLQKNAGLWKGFNVEIGDGDVDYPAVREALTEIAYSGWATAEVKGGGRERLAEIARRMDEALSL